MNITIENKKIKKAIEIVKGGVDNNSNHLILSYVLFEIKNNTLTLTTTNTEIEIKTTTEIATDAKISFNLCLIDISNILNKLDDKTNVIFNIEDEKITITTDKNKFELNTLKNQKFNTLIDKGENFENFEINTKNLHHIINKTKFSIANDNPQKYLNGLLLSIDEEKIVTASSDGHRLSFAQSIEKQNILDSKSIIIPKKTIEEINKLLADTDAVNIQISLNTNYIVITNNHTNISSKLIDGNYPDYKKVLPDDFDNSITLNKKEFEKSLKQVEIFTKENKTVKLDFNNNVLVITTESEKGSAKSELETQNFDKQLTIYFNASYLIQSLQNLDTENIVLNVDSVDPKVIVFNNESNENIKYLVMSIKV